LSNAAKLTPSAARLPARQQPRTWDKKNDKPQSPAMVGFLDNAQNQQKQRFASLTILSKNFEIKTPSARTVPILAGGFGRGKIGGQGVAVGRSCRMGK